MRAIAIVAAAAATLAFVAPADAQQTDARAFMMEAAEGGRAEVELGQVAAQRASRDDVRRFGQRMVTDHGKVNTELQALAQSKGVQLPTELDAQHRSVRDRLAALTGAEFDRAYMQEMLVDHQKDVDSFERQAQAASDADVKAFAAKQLPTLREHLRMAREIHTQVVLGPTPAAPAASVTTVTTARPAVEWCAGAYVPAGGTNFITCPKPKPAP